MLESNFFQGRVRREPRAGDLHVTSVWSVTVVAAGPAPSPAVLGYDGIALLATTAAGDD